MNNVKKVAMIAGTAFLLALAPVAAFADDNYGPSSQDSGAVQSEAPVPQQPSYEAVASADSGSLPSTGTDGVSILQAATAIGAVGSVMVFASSRRRRARA